MIEAGLLLALFLAVAAHQRACALADWQRAVLEALAGAVSQHPPPGRLDDPGHASSFVRDVVETGVRNWRGVLDLTEIMTEPHASRALVNDEALLDAILTNYSARARK
jgi:hypothetical protein